MAKRTTKKSVEVIAHDDKRKNIPSAEDVPLVSDAQKTPTVVSFARRNPDLDPQLVWRGKQIIDWSDLMVPAPPIYIQEKVRPQAIIADLLRDTADRQKDDDEEAEDLGLFADRFAHDFNGLPENAERTDFYQHEGKWSNRMILGDSLQVMASLIEREGLRGKVQCIYFDPPYGIKFNSNFQWSTTSRDVKDGNAAHITREPEQVKAFRDTWRDGIHSYLTYLRDRLTVAKDLLTDSGSIFVQISDQNIHRLRCLMDEVFGEENFCGMIFFSKTTGSSSGILPSVGDILVWYSRSRAEVKFRRVLRELTLEEEANKEFKDLLLANLNTRKTTLSERHNPSSIPGDARLFRTNTAVSPEPSATLTKEITFACGATIHCGQHRHWKTNEEGLLRLEKAGRLEFSQGPTRLYRRFFADNQYAAIANVWTDTRSEQNQVYVVQTKDDVVARCLLMTTDPGDLVLDPTCGSGTTAYVAEQWGRRWITIDTSRVALALARARLMGGRFPYYLLADSKEGQEKEAEVTRTIPSSRPTFGNIKHGFVYERVPHIQLSDIANNAEIDVIWEKWQSKLSAISGQISAKLKRKTPFEEWEIPREAEAGWGAEVKKLHAEWWDARIKRQKEIDASIAAKAKADAEFLYDKPYPDPKKVRVSGPFTVESLSPHRMLAVGADDELIDPMRRQTPEVKSFDEMILEQLRTAGVQQAHKEGRIQFTSLKPYPGRYICGIGMYTDADEKEKKAGVFIGPEFGTVQRADLVAAAREAGEAGFDVVVACAFNYEAHTTEFDKLGKIPILKARMNADLHMAEDLKNTGKGNLFVVFGEPDIEVLKADGGRVRVKVKGVDVFKPQTGEVVSSNTDGIACWFVDTDYNGESFFVRQAYFLGQADPYGALRTTLKAEIDAEAWATLNSDTSRPFAKPKGGQIAVKVINHLGDEVMKVFRV